MSLSVKKLFPKEWTDAGGLNQLCLGTPQYDPGAPVGLLGPIPTGISYDLESIRSHPIYRYLLDHVPSLLEVAEGKSPEIESQLVQLAVVKLTLGFARADLPDGNKERRDKKRTANKNAVRRVLGLLDSGTVLLQQGRASLLRELLSEVDGQLDERRRAAVDHPVLLSLAYGLYEKFRVADEKIILDVADALGRHIDPITAKRYIKEAQELP